MSGRSETNTFDNGLYSTPSESTKTVRFGLLFEIIQSTRIFRTLSCRVLYRSRAIFELQHDNTCLLDWMFRHRGHRGSTDTPHLERFDANNNNNNNNTNNNNNNYTQLVTRHMSVNAYSYIYERTESQARTGGLSATVGFIVQMSFKLFFEGLLC